jgi:dihydropteroate synthase
MATPTPLVWDLIDAADAQAFLAPIEPPSVAPEPLPLPARAVRWSPPCPIDRSRLVGLTVVPGGRGGALVGSSQALRLWAQHADSPLGRSAARALESYDRETLGWRWADGSLHSSAARPCLLGILNVTPDSFSDGGRFCDLGSAIEHVNRMLAAGADVIDVGGESSRPGATEIDELTEAQRVIPVLEALRREFPAARLSIDTRRPEIACAALDRGVAMINDITALADPAMRRLAAESGVPVILMHRRGSPATMQNDTEYRDLVGEVAHYLNQSAAAAQAAGCAADRILLDPGFGFGKSARGNQLMLRQLASFRSLGYPLAVGLSRKRFIGDATQVSNPAHRLAGSVAAAAWATLQGAALLRVHDVEATLQAVRWAATMRTEALEPECGA